MNNNNKSDFVETITLTRENYDGFCKKVADLEETIKIENVNKAIMSTKIDDLMNDISKLREGVLSLLFDEHWLWEEHPTKDEMLNEKEYAIRDAYEKAQKLGISLDRIKEYLSNLYDDKFGEESNSQVE